MTDLDGVRLIRSPGLAATPYAYAAAAPASHHLVFLAGSCPLDENGRTVCPDDPAGQARQCLANLRAVLAGMGADLADVVATRVLVASSERADLLAAWEVHAEDFGDHDVPSTLVGVTVLGYPDQVVEIEAVAIVRDIPGAT